MFNLRCLFLIALGLLISLNLCRADVPAVTVTITQPEPIEALSTDGTVSGVSRATVGAKYTFVSSDAQRVILKDAQGNSFRIGIAATDYTPPAAVTTAAAQTPQPTTTTNATPAAPPSNLAATSSGNTSDSSAPISDDAVATINKALGKPFFTTQPFWKESALLVADRLGLGLEDKTKWEAAYRRYYYDKNGMYAPAPILGGTAYCVALYADANDNPTSVLIAFTNDGDYQGVSVISNAIQELRHPSGTPRPDANQLIDELQAKMRSFRGSFEEDRQAEQVTLTRNLNMLLGEPQKMPLGSNDATREDVLRWDWHCVSFLLSCQAHYYNLLRIIPTELADKHGITERIPHDEMIAKLTNAVEHRPNGDVVITQLPMADQGLKGYCAPATWERVLRYTGVPGDMYTLSRIANTDFGGGTLVSKLDETLYDYGRKAEFIHFDKFDAYSLHTYIDQGIPIFWGVNPSGYVPSEQRYALCDRDKDWDSWKKLLEQSRSPTNAKPPPLEVMQGHAVLITGYNPDTQEIAWSDPWGRNTQERWMTIEEAQRCSLGEFYIITW